ncbi:hypothetical protein IAU59_005937 [Kwoniella sp. CBS 9459]
MSTIPNGAGASRRPPSPRFRSTPPPPSSQSHAFDADAPSQPRLISTPHAGFFQDFLSSANAPDDDDLTRLDQPCGSGWHSSASSSTSSSPTTLLPYLCGSPEPALSSSSNTPFPDTLPQPASPTIHDKADVIGALPAKSKTLPSYKSNTTGLGVKGRQVPKRRPTPLVLGKASEQMGLDEELAVQRDGREAGRSMTAVSTHSDDASSLNNELQDLSLLRKSVKQNLLARPLDSPLAGSSSDRESSGFLSPNPDRPTFSSSAPSRLPDDVETTTVAEILQYLQSSAQLLIIDTRPIGSFLDAHLPRSANISIPSLIFKRFKKSPGGQSTSWDALGGFVSTQAGRGIWDGLETDKHMDVVIVGSTSSDELATVLYRIMKSLVRDGIVRLLQGGWSAVASSSQASDALVSGELSTKLRPTLATSLPPPRSAPAFDIAAPPPMLMAPSTPSRALNQRPSMPSLRADGPNAKRALPSLTIAVGETTQALQKGAPTPRPGLGTSGRRGPKLSLNFDRPARSATMGSFPRDGPPPPTPGLGKSGLLHVDTSSAMAAKSPRTPGFSISIPKTPHHGSVQTLAHAQSDYPPSPRSFGDIQNGMRPEADVMHSTSKPPSAPWSSHTTARPIDGARTPGLLPNGNHHSLDSEDDINMATARNGMAPFIVSTILPSFLYLGPEISSKEEVDYLKRLGIKRILNVAIECDDDAGLDLKKGFKYHRIPMRDIVEESGIAQGMRESCNILDDARLHSAPTYVHCKAGKSRSVTVVLAYLIHANAWTLKTSYAYVAERRKGISPNIGFVAELMQFEESELGLKQSGGVHGEGGGGGGRKATPAGNGHGQAENHEDRVNKNPRYMRESLPPAWSSSLDTHSRPDRVSPIGTGDQAGGKNVDDKDEEKGRRQVGDEREVRKNGQWVHHRRAPVDRTTLQPGRRVSKAGLESLRPLQTTSITGPGTQGDRPSPAPSPSLKDGGHGGHAATPAGEGPLKWI